MIGLDTNVLLRYYLQDDPEQSPKATHLIETQLSVEDPGYISLIAMMEFVWVVSRVYNFAHEHIIWILQQMLLARQLRIQNELEVFKAFSVLESREGDFADALIGALGLRSSCTHTFTFDRKASRLPGMKLI